MKADREHPLLIQVIDRDQVIGSITTREFREYMCEPNTSLSVLMYKFNNEKEMLGEPERVSTALNIGEARSIYSRMRKGQ